MGVSGDDLRLKWFFSLDLLLKRAVGCSGSEASGPKRGGAYKGTVYCN